MTIATGIAKVLAFKKESVWGTAAGASGGQLLRRVTSNLAQNKDSYQSNELRTDYQVQDLRHGIRSVAGTIQGELSPLTYSLFMAAALRKDFAAGSASGPLTTVAAASTSGAAGTFTRTGGSWITDGFRVGDVVRWSGWAAPATANNAKNMVITALTATVMTALTLDGSPVVAKAAGDSVTATVFGKKTYVPTSGHTDDSFSIEHWHSDLGKSELFTGCKVSQLEIAMPATGMATINTQIMGKDLTPDTNQYFTAANPLTSTGLLTAVNGILLVDGAPVNNVTGMQLTINGNMTGEAVVGSNSRPDIFEGRVVVTGQITCFYQDTAFRDWFRDETLKSLAMVMTTGSGANADFLTFNMGSCKASSYAKDDGEKGLVETLAFQALVPTAGGAVLGSTIAIQDSAA